MMQKYRKTKLQKNFLLVLTVCLVAGVFYGVNLSRTTTPTIANNIYGEHQTVNTRRSFFPTQKAADDIPVADDKDLEEKSDDNVTSSTKSHLSSTAFQLTADPKPTKPEFMAVVLLTYMRSGSSITGDILQQDPGVFYVFEPMRTLDRCTTLQKPISFLNGTVLEYGQYNRSLIHQEALRGWLTCDMTRIFAQSVADTFLAFGRKTKTLGECLKLTGSIHFRRFHKHPENTYRNENYRKCVLLLRYLCLTSKYRVIKTIRATMRDTWEVVKNIDGSKVVHLVRDPRPTIDSKRKKGACKKDLGGVAGCAERHCNRVRDDTMLRERLQISEPEKFQVVLYEDIALKPVETSKRMYEFLDMDFTDEIARYVYNVTLGEDQTGCKVCKTGWQMGHSNTSSASHVTSWKAKMNPGLIDMIQTRCLYAMATYGYEYFKSESTSKRPVVRTQTPRRAEAYRPTAKVSEPSDSRSEPPRSELNYRSQTTPSLAELARRLSGKARERMSAQENIVDDTLHVTESRNHTGNTKIKTLDVNRRQGAAEKAVEEAHYASVRNDLPTGGRSDHELEYTKPSENP